MDCLISRRLLFTDPLVENAEHRVHVGTCTGCAKLARRLHVLECAIERSACVQLPEALTERILLASCVRAPLPSARAAAFALAAIALGSLGAGVAAVHSGSAVQAVGPSHPAVAAIAEVEHELPRVLPVGDADQTVEVRRVLRRLGLTLKQGEAAAGYVGKCHIDATSECERIIVSTPTEHGTVMLLQDYPFRDRIVVAKHRMVALAAPAGTGGYIVVADSEEIARRLEKVLIKS
jgi:hypothetical protein